MTVFFELLFINNNILGGFMIKKLLVVSIAALGIGLNGCLTDPEESSAPSITLQSIGTVTAGSGTAVTKTGKIEASDSITNVTYKIFTAAGVAVEASKITVTGTPKNNKKSLDITVSIQAFAGAQSGNYNLRISATTNVTSDVNFPFTVEGVATTPVTEKDLVLGAQSNTNPSLLDADNMVAYSSSITDASTQAKIDLIFSYATILTNDALAFTSPSVAAGTPYSTWPSTSKANTEFKKVTATWSSITTQEQIDALWGTGAGSNRIVVAQGDIIIVKTSAGKYKLVSINTLTGAGAQASISVKGLY